MNNEEMKRKIKELRERLSDVPPEVQLRNIMEFMTTCWKCEAEVEWDALVCEKCGNELTEFGKN